MALPVVLDIQGQEGGCSEWGFSNKEGPYLVDYTGTLKAFDNCVRGSGGGDIRD